MGQAKLTGSVVNYKEALRIAIEQGDNKRLREIYEQIIAKKSIKGARALFDSSVRVYTYKRKECLPELWRALGSIDHSINHGFAKEVNIYCGNFYAGLMKELNFFAESIFELNERIEFFSQCAEGWFEPMPEQRSQDYASEMCKTGISLEFQHQLWHFAFDVLPARREAEAIIKAISTKGMLPSIKQKGL